MSKNNESLIKGYEQANKDASEIIYYLDFINSPSQLEESMLPSLVKSLENQESVAAQNYINCASIVGGNVATTVSLSVSTGMLSKGLAGGAMILGGAMVIGGIYFMIPGLNLLAIPVMAVPLAIKLVSDTKVKRYIKDNKEDMKQKKAKLEKNKEKLLKWLEVLQRRSVEIEEMIRANVDKKFEEYKTKTKQFAKDVSIQIDDCVNSNTNKRIMQYNEVILKQYKLQKDLEEKVDFLFDEYNKLFEEKKELERQINCLVKLLNALNCPEAVINQALNEEA